MKRNSGRKLALLSGVVLIVYLSFHLFFGDRGYIKLKALRVDLAESTLDADTSIAARKAWEKKVVPFRSQTLDPDAVEEKSREVLGYRRADEKVILLHEQE